MCNFVCNGSGLSGPISRDIAILSLRYPISRDAFSGKLALPQEDAIPPPPTSYLVLHRHISVCNTPFCNISRDNCAVPHENTSTTSFAIPSLQVSRDVKSIADGPLRFWGNFLEKFALQSPWNFSEVAPEVHPAVRTALLLSCHVLAGILAGEKLEDGTSISG